MSVGGDPAVLLQVGTAFRALIGASRRGLRSPSAGRASATRSGTVVGSCLLIGAVSGRLDLGWRDPAGRCFQARRITTCRSIRSSRGPDRP